mmetsp:Transcript_42200/g.103402  ORF Transcript_42200/g.103402 Transcript_42200/m.103402 type:complete len:212 (+) Transcript_42200:256-891(+)
MNPGRLGNSSAPKRIELCTPSTSASSCTHVNCLMIALTPNKHPSCSFHLVLSASSAAVEYALRIRRNSDSSCGSERSPATLHSFSAHALRVADHTSTSPHTTTSCSRGSTASTSASRPESAACRFTHSNTWRYARCRTTGLAEAGAARAKAGSAGEVRGSRLRRCRSWSSASLILLLDLSAVASPSSAAACPLAPSTRPELSDHPNLRSSA